MLFQNSDWGYGNGTILWGWRKVYGSLHIEQAKRLKELEKENGRLRKVYGYTARKTAFLVGFVGEAILMVLLLLIVPLPRIAC
jgi:hypothetical protein